MVLVFVWWECCESALLVGLSAVSHTHHSIYRLSWETDLINEGIPLLKEDPPSLLLLGTGNPYFFTACGQIHSSSENAQIAQPRRPLPSLSINDTVGVLREGVGI